MVHSDDDNAQPSQPSALSASVEGFMHHFSSDEMLRAAANPARVGYLFFVRKPDGVHHFFTASESEFFRKKCEYGFGC